MKKLFTQKLQWQYFASYLALMVSVMAVFFAYSYNSFYQFHSKIVMDNYTSRLGLIRNEQEETLDDMMAIASQIMGVTSIVPFDYSEEPEEALQLIDQMSAYKATHDALEGIYIHFYDDEFVYSATGLYTTERFVNNAVIFSSVEKETVRSLLEETEYITMLPRQSLEGYGFQSTMGVREMVPVFVPVSVKNGLRCGTAMFVVEDITYDRWFTTLGSEEADIYILQENEPIYARQISSVPAEALLEASSKGESIVFWEGGKYHLLELAGSRYNYRYLMLLPDTELQVGMSASVHMLMLLAAVVAALGVLIITYFVQKRMKPIKLLHSMISDREPSGNELLEIRDGIQRLIEENAAMSTRMEDVETLRKSDFVRRFLTGSFRSEDEFLSYAETISLNVDTACFAAIIIAKPGASEYELTAEKVNHLFDDKVSGVARDLSFQERVVAVAFADDADMLMDFLEQKLAGLRACCTGVTMASSGVHSSFSEGQRAYLEAENAFELRFIEGNTQMLRFRQRDGLPAGKVQHSQQLMDRLRKALRSGDASQISYMLREITHSMRSTNAALFDFRCMYNDILNVVSWEARELGVREDEVYDLFKLSQCLSLDDLDTMLHHVCSRIVLGRVEQRPAEASDAVVKAREIIERRFSEPGLSVSAIAEEVGMTDSRLSTEFKKAYRMTPLEFITVSRMHRARRLLRTTDMPVKDIALECGYYDISGFNRRFKAYTGMTPQQYKQSSEAGNEQAVKAELPQDLAGVEYQEEQ